MEREGLIAKDWITKHIIVPCYGSPLCTLAEGFVVMRLIRIRMAGGEKRIGAVLDNEIILLRGS